MPEPGRAPGHGPVAVVTDFGTLDVAEVLARCGYTVVTTRTIADYLRMIDTRYGAPGGLMMTIPALLRRQDMIRRYRCRLDEPGTCVTTFALARRPTKNSGNMASLTIYISMRALQRITRRKMIESGVECRLSRCGHNRQHQNRRQHSSGYI